MNHDEALRYCQVIVDRYRDHGHSFWAMIRRDDDRFVGICGPLRQVVEGREEIEIGYRVLPAYRRRGYAREMAGTMWAYAASHPDVRVLRATLAPDNAGSRAIVEGAGFRHVGEQDDPEDGLELVYERPVPDYPPT